MLGAIRPFDVVIGGAILSVALVASGHAIIYKREPRSAALWFFIIWSLPVIGSALYVLAGVNRVERRAAKLKREDIRRRKQSRGEDGTRSGARSTDECLRPLPQNLRSLAQLVENIVPRPLLTGNAIEPLDGGPEAFPAMLGAIRSAQVSVCISSYIFDGEGIGQEFVEALSDAQRRGIEVRALIDDVDARFSRKSAVRGLRKSQVRVGVFNPPLVPARLYAVHLRNHRKILVVDGKEGFTGGLNVDCRYWSAEPSEEVFRDLHFRIRGPVVAHLMEIFADDWQFATGEILRGNAWFPALTESGPARARGIESGPDESSDRLRWTMIGAINAAQRSVRVCTPYFIPDPALISALNGASLRGVEVDILLPENSDLPHVQWAIFGQLWQVLERGCRVWLHPGSFDHSKLMIVDGAWTLLGSANWDARSLRLNFEFNMECYCGMLGSRMEARVQARKAHAREITLRDVDDRALAIKIRDGIARLFAPYL